MAYPKLVRKKTCFPIDVFGTPNVSEAATPHTDNVQLLHNLFEQNTLVIHHRAQYAKEHDWSVEGRHLYEPDRIPVVEQSMHEKTWLEGHF